MIIGVGCDVLSISRIKGILERKEESFLKRIFTNYEIETAPNHKGKRINYFSKRFAAKEALAKALGFGIGSKLKFIDIEIQKDSYGKPYFPDKVLAKIGIPGLRLHLSLSDDTDIAIAYVVAEKVSTADE